MSTILIHDLQTTDELTNLTDEELEMRGGGKVLLALALVAVIIALCKCA
jgi:hypothetical protein